MYNKSITISRDILYWYFLPIVFVFLILTSVVEAAPKNLFSNVSSDNALDVTNSASAKQKFVGVNTTMFRAYAAPNAESMDLPSSLNIDLFGKVVSANFDRFEQISRDTISWIGHINNDNADQVILVINDSLMQGNITYKNQQYQIRFAGSNSNGDAVHTLQLIDSSKLPDEHPPEFPSGVLDNTSVSGNKNSATTSLGNSSQPDASADSGAVIDVMVVWTPAARTAAGGTTAMNTLVDLALTETNQGYVNSGVTPTMNLVHKQEISYTESGSFSTDLNRLKATSDGYIDNVHTLRDTHKADMVGMLIKDPSYCGLAAGINVTAANAFQVTAWGCATGYYSFAHEFGHLQAARHNWSTDGTNNSPYTYNHGHVHDGASSWRTIMSYNVCSGGSCPRLKYWSNPDKTYAGSPMGVPEGSSQASDNRKTLNNTAYTVANFRTSGGGVPSAATLVSPSGSISDTTPTFTWNAVSSATYYYLHVNDSTGHKYGTWHSAAASGCNSGTGTCSTTPSTVLATGGGAWWIKTWNPSGYGPWSSSKAFNITGGGGVPSAATQVSPSGTISDTTPTFIWNAVSNSTYYYLYVNDSTGHKYGTWYTPAALGCSSGTGTCSVTPSTVLATGSGAWWVKTWNTSGFGPWSSGKGFNIAADCNINEHFSSTPTDWTQESGTWNVVSSLWWYTAGQNEKANVSRYSGGSCDNIDITTSTWKAHASGNSINPVRLLLRTSGTIDSTGHYPNAYLFQYSAESGQFSVFKHVAGVETSLKSWTTSSTINAGNAWNKMRVYANGSNFSFYINDTLVWTGSDSSLSTGKSQFVIAKR